MATKKAAAKKAAKKSAGPKQITLRELDRDIRAVIKDLEKARKSAAKAFKKAPLVATLPDGSKKDALDETRGILQTAADNLQKAISEAHGDDGTGDNT